MIDLKKVFQILKEEAPPAPPPASGSAPPPSMGGMPPLGGGFPSGPSMGGGLGGFGGLPMGGQQQNQGIKAATVDVETPNVWKLMRKILDSNDKK